MTETLPALGRLSRVPWLALGVALGTVLAFAVVALGWDRSFWYDEVFTLGAAAIGRPLDWSNLLRDVHPPTHVLVVRWFGDLIGTPASPALRLTNLVGLIPLAATFAILARRIERPRLLLLAILYLFNFYTLNLALDLRSYFILLGTATLAQAVFFSERHDGRPRSAALVALAALLCALHFFGAAIGLSLLGVSALLWLREGRPARALALIAAAGLLAALVLYYAFAISQAGSKTGGQMWITNGPAPFVDFLSWQLPLAFLALLLLVYRHAPGPGPAARARAFEALAAPALVVVVTVAISMHTPVVTSRNLVVCVPGVSLAAALACPPTLVARLRASPLLLLVLAAIGLRYGDIATANAQMIRWAIRTATPPACDGVPLYVAGPDIVDEMAQDVFLGGQHRPLRDFTDFDPDAPWPPDCSMLGVGWHEYGKVSDVTAFFAAKGVRTEALLPPDQRLARQGLMTHGFVIRRLP